MNTLDVARFPGLRGVILDELRRIKQEDAERWIRK